MIVGFSKHGTGGGKGPINYLTDPKLKDRDISPPEVLRGNPELTRQLIDSLDFKWKYTSGVLSFAPNEKITPEMERAIMDRFESVAFAGLEKDQYCCLWVRHSHAGHHELHFVTPRVELSTGKSLNIKPPGKLAQEHFDDLRSEINARYGLADPDDPDRARAHKPPSHILKGGKEDIGTALNSIIEQRLVNGLIKSRSDVVEAIQALGINVPRQGKDYITAEINGKKTRLKGALYERDFDINKAIAGASAARERDYSRPDPKASERAAQRVERHIAARTQYNQNRYRPTNQGARVANIQEPIPMAIHNRVEPLSRYLARQLGRDALPIRAHPNNANDSKPTRAGSGQSIDHQVRGTPVYSGGNATILHGKQDDIHDYRGVLNDRTTTSPSTAASRSGFERALDSIRVAIDRVGRAVRNFCEERAFRNAYTTAQSRVHECAQFRSSKEQSPMLNLQTFNNPAPEQRPRANNGLSM